MKPPIPNFTPKIKSTSPLSKITEKDETCIVQTESFEFTAQMEDIDEGSRDPSISMKRKNSVEGTQFFNRNSSFEFDEFNSMDFKEYSCQAQNTNSNHSRLKMEDLGSSICCASVTSDSAHAQILFPTKEQRVTLGQMKDNENAESE